MYYKKAYDMVPHSWIIESLKMAEVARNILTFLQKSMVNWKTELTSCGETLGVVDIKRGGGGPLWWGVRYISAR